MTLHLEMNFRQTLRSLIISDNVCSDVILLTFMFVLAIESHFENYVTEYRQIAT